MAERLLDVRAMDVGYAGVAVVRGLTMHVDAGEVVALLGPNGAGKSTTLLAISGLLALLDGTVEVLGAPVDRRRPHLAARRGLAHVAEDRALFSQLTVDENLRLGHRGLRSQLPARLAEVLDLLPALAGLRNRPAGLLSGGEQQMLALARALVSQPRLLLIDEMSMGLAPLIVEDLLPIVRDVAANTGAGVLLVEQHLHAALAVADRGYVLRHGEVVLAGPSARLSADPDLLRASYLGRGIA